MASEILTPRLRLTRLTRADPCSEEFAWLHSLWSDEKASFWSLGGKTKSFEETEAKVKSILHGNNEPEPSYRFTYLVHEIQEPATPRFIGTVSLKGTASGLSLPGHLSLPAANEPGTLSLETGYSFLPAAWGKGYATEAVSALFDACCRAKNAWDPYTQVYVRAIVKPENLASQGVVKKCGMTHLDNFEWTGEPVFIAGEWKEKDTIQIWGRILEIV